MQPDSRDLACLPRAFSLFPREKGQGVRPAYPS